MFLSREEMHFSSAGSQGAFWPGNTCAPSGGSVVVGSHSPFQRLWGSVMLYWPQNCRETLHLCNQYLVRTALKDVLCNFPVKASLTIASLKFCQKLMSQGWLSGKSLSIINNLKFLQKKNSLGVLNSWKVSSQHSFYLESVLRWGRQWLSLFLILWPPSLVFHTPTIREWCNKNISTQQQCLWGRRTTCRHHAKSCNS